MEKIAKEGKLRDLAGFGEKSEQNILKAVEVFKKIVGTIPDRVRRKQRRRRSARISGRREKRWRA